MFGQETLEGAARVARRVHDRQQHVRVGHRVADRLEHHLVELVELLFHHPGGVEQHHLVAVLADDAQDPVAGGLRLERHDGELGAHELVEQRALPGVRPAHDRDVPRSVPGRVSGEEVKVKVGEDVDGLDVLLILLLVLLLDFVLFGFFQLFGFAVAAAVRSLLHLPVPPHQLLDWNLRVCGEVVHLLLVIVVVTLGLRPSHLLFQSLLIVLIFLAVFDLEIVVVVEGLGGDWRPGLPASLATLGRSRHSSGFSDDVREGRLPGLLTRRARGVHRRGFVILDLDRLFENLGSLLFLLRLLHLAIPAE
mmetsp:Transcript_4120/g.18500  ORF Transcript_4120/g.18500 Transcript_4120/m.18500 type:complete len:307 (-) Transcript_4120:1564-2484(-)